MTIADAVALAGGATSDGKVDKVELRRDERKRLARSWQPDSAFLYLLVQSGDPNSSCHKKSWTSRNTGLVAAGITAMTTVVVTLLVR